MPTHTIRVLDAQGQQIRTYRHRPGAHWALATDPSGHTYWRRWRDVLAQLRAYRARGYTVRHTHAP